MKKYKINAVETAYFNDMVIGANSKEEAEEKFQKLYEEGKIQPDEFGFDELKIEDYNSENDIEKNREQVESIINGLLGEDPNDKGEDIEVTNKRIIEKWDNVSRTNLYLNKGYEIIKGGENEHSSDYLFSTKMKVLNEFISNLVNLPTCEFLSRFFPKRMFRCLAKETPENIVIRFITDEVTDFCKSQDIILSTQDNQQIADMTKETLLKNEVIVNNIVEHDNVYISQFKEEFINLHKDIKLTQKIVDEFLRNKGVWPPPYVVKYFYDSIKGADR